MRNRKTIHRKTLQHFNTPGHAHGLTFACFHHLDYLVDPAACEIVLDVLSVARDLYRFRLWAYVLMPDHVHLLIWPLEAEYDIAKISSGIKGIASKRYRKHLSGIDPARCKSFMVKSGGSELFRFWQQGGGYDRNIRSAKAIYRVLRYIEANPVKKGLCATPSEYRWSSAYARSRNEGLIPDVCNIPV